MSLTFPVRFQSEVIKVEIDSPGCRFCEKKNLCCSVKTFGFGNKCYLSNDKSSGNVFDDGLSRTVRLGSSWYYPEPRQLINKRTFNSSVITPYIGNPFI